MKKQLLTLLVPFLLLLGACGQQSFVPKSISNTKPSIEDTKPKPSPEEGDTVAPINYSGKISDNTGFFGSKGIVFYDNNDEALKVNIPFPFTFVLPAHMKGNLPNAPHISYEMSPSKGAIILSIPVEHYIELTQKPTRLPNGRKLPGISGGEPPSLGFPIPGLGHNAYVFAHIESLSLFMETNFKLPISFDLQFPIRGEGGSHLGSLYWLRSQNNGTVKGGLFLSLSLPRELSARIADFMK